MSDLYLIARIAGRAVAFAAHEVDSVVDLGVITPAPLAAAGVVGLAALRSRIVTVVDPRVMLGLDSAAAPGQRAVVGAVEGHLYAIVVEALEDVADYQTMPLLPGFALERGFAGISEALIDRAGESVPVVSLARLIPQTTSLAA